MEAAASSRAVVGAAKKVSGVGVGAPIESTLVESSKSPSANEKVSSKYDAKRWAFSSTSF